VEICKYVYSRHRFVLPSGERDVATQHHGGKDGEAMWTCSSSEKAVQGDTSGQGLENTVVTSYQSGQDTAQPTFGTSAGTTSLGVRSWERRTPPMESAYARLAAVHAPVPRSSSSA
jgi:hypothetical protein